MLDDDDNMSLPSRYYLRQRMSELPAAELVKLLSSDDVIARTVAGMCLHLAGGTQETHSAILDLASNEAAYVREVAAYTLGQFGTPDYPFRSESLPVLSRLADVDESDEVRLAATVAIMHLGGPDAAGRILRAAKDPSADIRRAAAWWLDLIDPTAETRSALADLCLDADPDVRREAEESVAYLAQHPSSECHERTTTRRTK
jgi:HEAT repeat protein